LNVAMQIIAPCLVSQEFLQNVAPEFRAKTSNGRNVEQQRTSNGSQK
jgi:hypothetical protein